MENKFFRLFKSRKFWASLVAISVTVAGVFIPEFPLDEEQVMKVVGVLVAFILGTAIEDSKK